MCVYLRSLVMVVVIDLSVCEVGVTCVCVFVCCVVGGVHHQNEEVPH